MTFLSYARINAPPELGFDASRMSVASKSSYTARSFGSNFASRFYGTYLTYHFAHLMPTYIL
eukprot:4204100-Amphidinium_carterae.1